MRDLMLDLPAWLVMAFVALLSATLAIAVLIYLRRHIPYDKYKENHEVGGFLFNALGLIYAVIVAFVIYVSWSEYTEAVNYSEAEITALRSIYHNSKSFRPDVTEKIRTAIVSYTEAVIKDEWKLLGEGKVSEKARNEHLKLWNLVLTEPELKHIETDAVFQQCLVDLDELSKARVMRIATSRKNIPFVVWTVIMIGALTSVGFSLFFGTRDLKIQATMTALFAMTNALIMLLIFFLDHPFSGETGLSSDAYKEFLEVIRTHSNF